MKTVALVYFIVLIILLLPKVADTECLKVSQCQCETTATGDHVINCRDKNLAEVPKFEISSIYYKELTLAGNRIQNIQDGAFNGLRVDTLDLSNNPISYISQNAFQGIETDLKTLIISFQHNISLRTFSFSGLLNLKSLQIYGFSQSYLPDNAFKGLSFLEELVIVKGQLSVLNASLIDALIRLKSLVLDSNSFTTIPTEALKKVPTLKKFSIAHNSISKLNLVSFYTTSVIEDINLSENNLAENISPDAFSTLSQVLKYLTLSSCQLTDLSLQSLMSLKSLKTLDLQINNIRTLPDTFLNNLPSLLQLNLAGNKITNIPDNLFKQSRMALMNLNLRGNPLSITRSTNFTRLNFLEELNLASIQSIQFSSRVFEPMQASLKVLDLSNSKVDQSVLQSFAFLKMLQELNVSACSLSNIPELTFKGNPKLRILDISNNMLTNLPANAFQGLEKSLMQLDLHSNKLTTLDRCTFGQLQFLNYLKLNLQGNILQCDCKLQWLYNKIKTQNELYLDQLTWQCDNKQLFASMAKTFSDCTTGDIQCTNWFNNNTSYKALELEIKDTTEISAHLQWSVEGTKVIYGFFITYEILNGEQNYSKTIEVPSSPQYFTLTDLNPSTLYQFCINMLTSNDWAYETRSCKTGRTSDRSNYNYIGAIIGGVVSGIALIAIICLIVCLCCHFLRKKQNHNTEESANKTHSISLDDSYIKYNEKSTSQLHNQTYSSREIPCSLVTQLPNYFTNQEQDTILSFMLTSARSKTDKNSEKLSQKSNADFNVQPTTYGDTQSESKPKKKSKRNEPSEDVVDNRRGMARPIESSV